MPTYFDVPVFAISPFLLILAGIATLPFVAPRFWRRNRNKAVFSALLTTPIALWLVIAGPERLAHCAHLQALPVSVASVPAGVLAAISAGAVLMGANTYVANGPNFMVKSIAEASGCRMLSFARHALLAVAVLAPVYLLTALLVQFY